MAESEEPMKILEIRPNNAGGQTIVVNYEPKPILREVSNG